MKSVAESKTEVQFVKWSISRLSYQNPPNQSFISIYLFTDVI